MFNLSGRDLCDNNQTDPMVWMMSCSIKCLSYFRSLIDATSEAPDPELTAPDTLETRFQSTNSDTTGPHLAWGNIPLPVPKMLTWLVTNHVHMRKRAKYCFIYSASTQTCILHNSGAEHELACKAQNSRPCEELCTPGSPFIS